MSFPPSRPPVRPTFTFHLIPHTHWDREWYLTRAGFQARLVPVLDEIVEQLEHEGDARFVLDGQTILLEDYLAARPGKEARLDALVKRGALEVGPWYVLSDLLIPSAASLRRNLVEGRRDAEAFGGRMDVLYSPDAFGHPAALPALAAEFGIRRAVIRRGLGKPQGKDRDLYRWEAPTGESILVYHLPAGGYDIAIDLAGRGKNLAEQWAQVRQELIARAECDQVAVFLGADHHAMTPDVAGLRDQLQLLEPGHRVRVSGLAEYFDAVEKSGPDLTAIRGELRRIDGHAWVLQGVHATRSRMKRRHSRAELVLSRIAEPLARGTAEQRGPDRTSLIELAWRTLLQCQFHDTLAGTTSDAVQREQEVRLDAVETLCQEITATSLRELGKRTAASGASRLVLWNPSERPRGGILTAELTFFRKDVLVGPPSRRKARTGLGQQPFALADAAGALIPVQLLGVRRDQERVDSPRRYPDQDEVDRVWVAFAAPHVPAFGLSGLAPRTGSPAPSPEPRGLRVRPGFLANPHVELHVTPIGTLTVTDRHTGQVYRDLAELEDEADRGDTYTFSAGSNPVARGGVPESSRVVAQGPLVGAVETQWAMRSAGNGRIMVRLLVVLHADSPIVRLRFDIENQAIDHRLRARFPVGAGTAAMAGAAFGEERRLPATDPVKRDVLEQPVRTAPAQRFVAAGDGARGLAVLAPGFFEYEWTAKRDLVVTLVRSVGELSRNDLPERPGHAAWPMPTPEAQETGSHTIELALVPAASAATLGPARLIEYWEDAFLPVQTSFARSGADT
jgi:hypothetical protein